MTRVAVFCGTGLKRRLGRGGPRLEYAFQDPEQLKEDWRGMVKEVLQEATLTPQPDDAWMYLGGKRGEHTEHLGFILAEMQFLQRAYPDATTW